MTYVKGRTFEYLVKSYLERRGFYVVRSAGSHGSCDLLAFLDNEVTFIQCKVESKKTSYSSALKQLRDIPFTGNSNRTLWVRCKKNVIIRDQNGNLVHTMLTKELKD